jgi:hypothetical protein
MSQRRRWILSAGPAIAACGEALRNCMMSFG